LDKDQLFQVILNGQNTPDYEIQMPSYDFLADEEVAGLSTYIMQHFGNSVDSISSDEVKKIREQQ